uniref:Auxin-repressed 12.5 kDa protein n=1 Tax=Rhizophora mucronata TaxID=61149 RepID=A0A2P2LF87_RHIMU
MEDLYHLYPRSVALVQDIETYFIHKKNSKCSSQQRSTTLTGLHKLSIRQALAQKLKIVASQIVGLKRRKHGSRHNNPVKTTRAKSEKDTIYMAS